MTESQIQQTHFQRISQVKQYIHAHVDEPLNHGRIGTDDRITDEK